MGSVATVAVATASARVADVGALGEATVEAAVDDTVGALGEETVEAVVKATVEAAVEATVEALGEATVEAVQAQVRSKYASRGGAANTAPHCERRTRYCRRVRRRRARRQTASHALILDPRACEYTIVSSEDIEQRREPRLDERVPIPKLERSYRLR